jgi:ribosomal protein S18 acetylase RimI-like enzyme
MADQVSIERGDEQDISAVRELWLGLHRHHARVMPELAPYLSEDESWTERESIYRRVLSREKSVLLLARVGAANVGYAIGFVATAEEKAWLDDTWVNTGNVGEVESLGVVPEQRGGGIGTLLLERLERELRSLGAEDLVLGVLPGNDQAIRLYARFGYRPTWMYLSKLVGR